MFNLYQMDLGQGEEGKYQGQEVGKESSSVQPA